MPIERRTFIESTLALAAGALVAAKADETPEDNSKLGKTPHTKFAVNVEMWWHKLPFIERIENAAALGFPAVEFWPYENKDIDATQKAAEKAKIAISQFTAWGFSPGLNDPKNHDGSSRPSRTPARSPTS